MLVPLLRIALVLSLLSMTSSARVPKLSQIAEEAVAKSQLTLPGSIPFHLKAKIVETTNPESDYRGEVEEYWLAPNKWRRTVQAPGFSEVSIVNGDKVYQQHTGDYFPFWLRELVLALFEPLPQLDQLRQSNFELPQVRPVAGATSCARFKSKVGIPPVQNDVYFVFCFAGPERLLDTVVTPGYAVLFKDYKSFGDKRVARKIVTDPEPGTTLEETVTELDKLMQPNEGLFSIQESTPESQQLTTVVLSEETARNLALDAPEIKWPAVRSGKTSGMLSMYIAVDRSGVVRETWPLNSDNAGLDDSAREQVRKWRFRTATVHGVPVQFETILTFAFRTQLEH